MTFGMASTPLDILLIKQTGVQILGVIDQSSELLEPIRAQVTNELGVIRALSNEEANFKNLGLKREWKRPDHHPK